MQNHVRNKMAARKVCWGNDGQVMACFLQRCSEKHGREIKIKDLNPAERRQLSLQASMIRVIRKGI